MFPQAIRILFEVGTVGGLTDGQLLEQFAARRDRGCLRGAGGATWADGPERVRVSARRLARR